LTENYPVECLIDTLEILENGRRAEFDLSIWAIFVFARVLALHHQKHSDQLFANSNLFNRDSIEPFVCKTFESVTKHGELIEDGPHEILVIGFAACARWFLIDV
jgi:hypothetical protein